MRRHAVRQHLLPRYGVAAAEIERDVRGEALVGFVVGRSATPDPDTIIAHLEQRLVRYKVPAHIRIVDALPRTAVGKTDKPALRILAAESAA